VRQEIVQDRWPAIRVAIQTIGETAAQMHIAMSGTPGLGCCSTPGGGTSRLPTPEENAIVLCADEKSQIQALDRTAPTLPMQPDATRTRERREVMQQVLPRDPARRPPTS
jgi:hypothetical protein